MSTIFSTTISHDAPNRNSAQDPQFNHPKSRNISSLFCQNILSHASYRAMLWQHHLVSFSGQGEWGQKEKIWKPNWCVAKNREAQLSYRAVVHANDENYHHSYICISHDKPNRCSAQDSQFNHPVSCNISSFCCQNVFSFFSHGMRHGYTLRCLKSFPHTCQNKLVRIGAVFLAKNVFDLWFSRSEAQVRSVPALQTGRLEGP